MIAGGLTPTEILIAWECGSDLVKSVSLQCRRRSQLHQVAERPVSANSLHSYRWSEPPDGCGFYSRPAPRH